MHKYEIGTWWTCFDVKLQKNLHWQRWTNKWKFRGYSKESSMFPRRLINKNHFRDIQEEERGIDGVDKM